MFKVETCGLIYIIESILLFEKEKIVNQQNETISSMVFANNLLDKKPEPFVLHI